jgi:sugar lactone lactonase YvrE
VDLKEIMLVDDVKPGMKGYGKTVFLGTKISTFKVEVIGVLKKVNNGTDLIVVKMSGGPMTERGANLIHGVSGSPIYINGKLVGAFAYGESFVKEPIGLVTPIQYMLEAWDSSLSAIPSSFSSFSASFQKPIQLDAGSLGKLASESGIGSYDERTMVFQPLSMPFYVSGASPRVLSSLQNSLKPFNITPLAGPGAASDMSNLDVKLEPGSSVGVSLMTGDMDMTVIGTVTYRRGDKILAFGHPMLGAGAIEAPLTTAYVYGVSPNLESSSKIAGPIKTVGTLIQDRPWGIYGQVSKMPRMVPVTVHVSDKGLGRVRAFNVRVTNHPLLSKILVGAAVSEAISEMRPVPAEATVRIKFEVDADGVKPIVRDNVFFSSTSADSASTGELEQVLAMLQVNPFHPVDVKKVSVWVDMDSNHKTAKLERVFLKQSKFEPGDTVEIGAILRPFKGDRFTKTLRLKLPKNMPAGTFSLAISGGMPRGLEALIEEAVSGNAQMGGSGMGSSSVTPSIENIDQMMKKFLEREKNNDLIAKIVLPKPVPSIGGVKFSGLPPTIGDAMKSSKSTVLGTDHDEVKSVLSTDYIIAGTQRLMITVKKQGLAEKKSDAKKSTEVVPSSPIEPSAESTVSSDDGDDADGFTISNQRSIALVDDSSPIAPASVEKPDSQDTDSESASSESESKPEEKSPSAEESKPSVPSVADKPVIRTSTTWKQSTKNDFSGGKFVNTIATTGDLVQLGPSIRTLGEMAETYVWSILPDGKGNLYAGTGNHGIIYKIAADGSIAPFYKSPALEVNSLAKDSVGNIYAGTSPDGRIYKIDPNGKASVFFKADEKYVVALAFDGKGNLYAAVGDACKVYKIAPDGKSSVALDSTENYALSLAVDSSDNVYVGTGQDGLIYKIPPTGEASIVYDAAEEAVTALAIDSKGVLYAGTGSKGVIYKLAPNEPMKMIFDKAGSGITGLCADKSGVFAVNLGNVFRIMPDDAIATFDNKQDRQFLTAAAGDGQVYLGTGNVASVCTASIGKTVEGRFDSTVRDGLLPSTWGTISWTADLPTGAAVSLQTRTGNSAEPDASWSEWSVPCTTSGSRIQSPSNRYIQYRAVLKSSDLSASPKLKDVTIVYLPRNQAPKVTISSPKGGESWSKKQNLKWTGSDPDKDTLTYDLLYSSDMGATWKSLDIKTETSATKKEDDKSKTVIPVNELRAATLLATSEGASKQDVMDALTSELAKHPEIPAEIKQKLMAQVSDSDECAVKIEPKHEAGSESATKPRDAKQTDYKWDTTTVPDGVYIVKVVASDRLSNPVGALTGEAISKPITICNKPPTLVMLRKTASILPDKTVHVEGIAYQKLVGISCVQYRVDSGEWAAAAPNDGIYGSNLESFTIATQPLESGEHSVEVKAFDQAGNTVGTIFKAKLP